MAWLAVRPARILIAALSGVLVALVCTGVWLAVQAREEQARADDKQAALRAASTHAVNLISLGHRTVDDDMKRILDTSTGPARAEYAADAGKLRSTIIANKVVRHGVLRATGLVSLAGPVAKVLVVADVEISWDGSDNPPQERYYRWSMDVTRTGGGWLVSKVVQVT